MLLTVTKKNDGVPTAEPKGSVSNHGVDGRESQARRRPDTRSLGRVGLHTWQTDPGS